MKKTKFIFIFGIIIGLLFIGGNVLKGNVISSDKKEVSLDTGYDKYGEVALRLNFYKYDNNKNFLAGTKFMLSSYNNVYKLYPSEEYFTNDDVIITGGRVYSGENVFDNAYSMLSEKQKQIASSITTTNDFNNINNGDYLFCRPIYNDIPRGGELKREEGIYCDVPLPTVFTLEETKAPSGYAKTKVLVPGIIHLEYFVKGYQAPKVKSGQDIYYRVEDYFNGEEYDVELLGIFAYNFNAYIDYGDVDVNVLLGTDIEEAYNLMYENAQGTECLQNVKSNYKSLNQIQSIQSALPGGSLGLTDYRDFDFCYFSLFNEKGNVNLEVSTSVNDKNSITTTTNNSLKYKVLVKNTGSVDAIDSLVVSKLPEGFNYVEGSASNGGVYNSTDNTITWNVARLRVANEVELSYEAFAPEGASSLKSYIGEAYAQAFGMNNRIESNKTTVNLMLNPKTSAPIYGIIITLLIAWGVAGYLFLYKKYFMKKKKIKRRRKATA